MWCMQSYIWWTQIIGWILSAHRFNPSSISMPYGTHNWEANSRGVGGSSSTTVYVHRKSLTRTPSERFSWRYPVGHDTTTLCWCAYRLQAGRQSVKGHPIHPKTGHRFMERVNALKSTTSLAPSNFTSSMLNLSDQRGPVPVKRKRKVTHFTYSPQRNGSRKSKLLTWRERLCKDQPGLPPV